MTIEIVLNTNVLVIRSFNKSPQNYTTFPLEQTLVSGYFP